MTWGRHLFLAAVVSFAAGCRDAPNITDPIQKYGLMQVTRAHAEVAQGIVLANAALSPSVALRLVAAWEATPTNRSTTVPVYLVSGANLSRSDKVFVPDGERFVVVNADCLSDLPIVFHEAGHAYTNSILSVGIEKYLALMFLHELGHIQLGHSGSYHALPEYVDPELNLVENSGKVTELAADRFAAMQIKEGTLIATFPLRTALQNIVWNFNAWRSLEHFGSSELFVPAVYWDQGYSHPNLAFRMLIIADMVEPSETSRQMLKMFVEGRNRKPWNKVLKPIASLEEMLRVVNALGYAARIEILHDRTRFHVKHPPTRKEFFIDAWPGKTEAAIREIAAATGVNLSE